MIFTDLSYGQAGYNIAGLLFLMVIITIIYRLVMAFRHYIYNGNFGDFEKSAFVSLMEANGFDILIYSFRGYHPGGILVDALMLTLLCIVAIMFWAPMIIVVLLFLLGYTMRKRIAVKQEFVGNLKGDQLGE